MRKRLASLGLALLLVLGMLPMAASAAGVRYDDVAGHWAESSITRWSEYSIVEGNEGHFRPDASLTRGEMAKILANTLGLTDEGSTNPFGDVPADAWYTPYVLRCYVAGVMKGDGVNAKPADTITRQEAMVMLCRALGIPEKAGADLSSYKDHGDVADWALGYVAAMTESGIVQGVGQNSLAPMGNIDRASIMAILDRSVVQYINAPGTYTMEEKDGIILVAAGDVTLSGTTAADVLVAPGASGKTINFTNATVNGGITAQGNNIRMINTNSKLPQVNALGEGITMETGKPSGGNSGGSSGGSGTPSGPSKPSKPTAAVSVLVNGAAPAGQTLAVGSKLTANVTNPNDSTLVWSVGGFDVADSEGYTVTAADMGKVIYAKLVKEDKTVEVESTKFTVETSTDLDTEDANAPVKLPDLANTTYVDAEGNKVEVDLSDENTKLVVSVTPKEVTKEQADTTKTQVQEKVETSVLEAVKGEESGSVTLTEEQKAAAAAAVEVKAVDVDLTMVTTTTEEDGTTKTEEAKIHPVGTTTVKLSAAQLGLAGEDLRLYHLVASHTNAKGVSQSIPGVVDEKGEYVTFTTNGLSTIWVGNIPPRTVTFDMAGGEAIASQKVRFGSRVNTSLLGTPTREGYIFCGWDYDLAKTPIIANMTVTAKWISGTKMPASQYTVTLNPTASTIDVKKEDGLATVAANPGTTYPATNAEVAFAPYTDAAKYTISEDAASAAGNTELKDVVGADAIQYSIPVADTTGVKTGRHTRYIKWVDANGNTLALQELVIVVSDGTAATDTITLTRNVNRGVGTFEPYLTSSAKPTLTKWVGYINGDAQRRYANGEQMYSLWASVAFEAWKLNGYKDFSESDYDTLHLDFKPFSGQSYAGKTASATARYYTEAGNKTVNCDTSVADGKLAVTVPTKGLNTSPEIYNIHLNLTVTMDGISQDIGISVPNPNYKRDTSGDYKEVSDIAGLRSALEEAQKKTGYVHINYINTNALTISEALTVPHNVSVHFMCDVTVGANGVITLQSGADRSAGISLDMANKKTFTVANGGKIVTKDVRAQNEGDRYSIAIGSYKIEMAQGSVAEVGAGTHLEFYTDNQNANTTCTLAAGSLVKLEGDTNNGNGNFDIVNFDTVTLAGSITATGGQVYLHNDYCLIDGTIAVSGDDIWGALELYGETIITETGKVQVSGRNNQFEAFAPLTNKGTIELSNSAYGVMTNTGFAQYNSGKITLGSDSQMSVEGTKLMNTGTITGGNLYMYVGDDITSYQTGLEYVEVDNTATTPDNYSRYKFTGEPSATVEVTFYKAELVNEQGGTCSATVDTEPLPTK